MLSQQPNPTVTLKLISQTNEVLEENGRYTKTMMDKTWNTLDKISVTSEYWKSDAMEAKKVMKEQVSP